jgi:hypothetical protein
VEFDLTIDEARGNKKTAAIKNSTKNIKNKKMPVIDILEYF